MQDLKQRGGLKCPLAGTGKSLLLKHILRALPAGTTFVTASTGLAASALGGTTINAFGAPKLSYVVPPDHLLDS
jgi:hypothetical protein